MIYDLIIIGGGPAGSAAAVYSARKQLKTLIIASEFGGQSSVSEKIYNWIGTTEISGADLAKNLENHVKSYVGEFLEVKTGIRVEKIDKESDKDLCDFVVKTNDGQSFITKSVLISTGSNRRRLDSSIPGADTLEHKGLTYCASCDGPMYSGLDVAVIGGGNAALETAAQLLAYCKSVTIFQRSAKFRADEITVAKIIANPKTQMTSVPGIWAAGDCTDILYHQNNIAAGDAVRALEDIYLFLHRNK